MPYCHADCARGTSSLLGIVLLWTGAWLLLDAIPGGSTSIVKEVSLCISGIALMMLTRTFFASAYMDDHDRDGSLKKLGAMLRERNVRGSEHVKFYCRSALAMFGAICFWCGTFNLIDRALTIQKHVVLVQLAVTAVCTSIVLYIIHKEDSTIADNDYETLTKRSLQGTGLHTLDDTTCLSVFAARVYADTFSAGYVYAGATTSWSEMSKCTRFGLYCKALVCNVAQVRLHSLYKYDCMQ
jgi:hypothetical protein